MAIPTLVLAACMAVCLGCLLLVQAVFFWLHGCAAERLAGRPGPNMSRKVCYTVSAAILVVTAWNLVAVAEMQADPQNPAWKLLVAWNIFMTFFLGLQYAVGFSALRVYDRIPKERESWGMTPRAAESAV